MRIGLSRVALGIALCVPTTAWAQEPPADGATKPVTKSKPKLDEIVVSAQKRSENIQDVPIAMSAIGGETIREHDIQDFNTLQAYIPNANLFEYSYGTFFRMRGLGSGFNDGFEQAVGFYIDDIYYGRGSYYNQGFLDFEQVEVLRGPQGTLFGKNTIAGAINIMTTRPSYEWQMEADTQFGNFNERRFTARITVPVIDDKFALRIAATDHERDGTIENFQTGIPAGQVDKQLARAAALIDVSDSLSLRFGLDYHSIRDAGSGLEMENGQADAMTLARAFNEREDGQANRTYTAGKAEKVARDAWGGTFHLDWDLAHHTLSFISGYSTYDEEIFLDADGITPNIISWDNYDTYSQQSAELRLVSDGESRLSYVIGLYYFANNYDAQTYLDVLNLEGEEGSILGAALPSAAEAILGDTLAELLGIPFNEAIAIVARDRLDQKFVQDTASYAAYGQLTWNVTEKLAIDYGLRVSYEEKDVELIQTYQDSGLILYFGLNSEEYTLVTTKSESNLLPKLSVRYHWSDDIMTYGTIADGFKAGGFNPFAPTKGQSQFDKEESRTFEVGIKSKIWDGRMTANLTYFHTLFKGLQLTTPGATGSSFLISNAGEATSKGVEFETQVMVLENLFVTGSFGWANATFDKYPDGPCQIEEEGPCDHKGKRVAESPEYTASLAANLGLPVGNMGFDWVLGVDVLYQGDLYLNADYDPISYEDANIKINARTGFRDHDGAWAFYIQGKNLTDEQTRLQNIDMPLFTNSYLSLVGPPRFISASFQLTL
ncbi:MAG: TonB-dependent receptor [Alphaproteobacteria bacterium]